MSELKKIENNIGVTKYRTVVNGQVFNIEVLPDGNVLVNGQHHEVDFRLLGETEICSIIKDDKSHDVLVEKHYNGNSYGVLLQGRLYTAEVASERDVLLNRDKPSKIERGPISIVAPMPGLIVEINVAEGEPVEANQTVIILESMKMQNNITVPRSGVIKNIHVKAGTSVSNQQPLITLAALQDQN